MDQPLTDTEALLWSIGQDPNLATTMGLVAILSEKPDPERLRVTVAATVRAVERLHQRVVNPSLASGGLGRPMWIADHQFELDHHFRIARIGTGRAATDAELRRAAAQFINDPFDLARPLWQFQLVTGLARGRAALLGKVHHSISDGLGLLRLAANLLEFEADAPAPESIDIDAELAAVHDVADQGEEKSTPERLFNWLQSTAQGLQLTAQGLPDPKKLVEAGAEAVQSARTISENLPKSGGSPLWSTRSRNRRLELLAVPAQSLRDRAEDLGVTINDLYVAACAQAAVHYHKEHGVDLPSITATVVVSTQPASQQDPPDEAQLTENAFVPVAITLPGSDASADERLEVVRSEVWKRRTQLKEKGDGLGLITALGGLVPSSIAASLAVDQAAKVDFATSNIPGPPVPTWLAGTPVERLYPIGPVSGTAFNVTLMTYDQEALFGLHLDPAAVSDGNLLKLSLGQGLSDFGVARR